MKAPDVPPVKGRRFYSVVDNGDGTVDVYLCPDESGVALLVRGVVDWPGLECNIRERYKDWCASGVPVAT